MPHPAGDVSPPRAAAAPPAGAPRGAAGVERRRRAEAYPDLEPPLWPVATLLGAAGLLGIALIW